MRSFREVKKPDEMPSTSRDAVETAINLTKEEGVLWEEEPCSHPPKRASISQNGSGDEPC